MAMRLTKEILASIPSGALSAVLREHGWRELTSNRPALSLWAPAEGSDPSELVLVPLDHTFDDFTLRLSEAIRRLARVLELTPDELAQDLITAASDILRFRADHETRSDGSIPLIDGVPLFQGIRGALLASAKAVEERRSYFGNAYWKQAQAFLRHARLGQTETGSYVVKVLARAATPETADVGDQVVTPGIDSRDRATVLMLLRAFAAARDATATFREGGEFTVFGDAVEDGVSADLCDAIVLMVDVETSHGVRIDATWSPLAHTPAAVPTQIKFSSEDIEPLKEASKRLRASIIEPKTSVQGWVEALSRAEKGTGPGVVVIVSEGGIVAKGGKVRASLGAQGYHDALAAHDAGRRVRVLGDLTRESNRYWLYNAELQPA